MEELQKKEKNGVKEFKIKLTPQENEMLGKKASKVGMTKKDYIKKLIAQDMTVIYVQDSDYREYAAAVEELNKTLLGILRFMKRTDADVIYKQDIERIKGIMEDVKTICSNQLMISYANRDKIKKIMRTMERYTIRHSDGGTLKNVNNLANKIVSIWTTGEWR